LLSQLLLPLFVVALLFSFAGIGAEVVVKAGASILIAVVQLTFKLLHALIDGIVKVLKTDEKRK
jgi:hypothetical protein